jgi:hypothetical protein
MNSFGILRTNVGLTTNIKISVDSKYNLSLNSIESNDELSNSRFKKVPFIKNNYYDELIPYFFRDFPADLAFHIKYDDDVDTMSDDFSNQYDEIYCYGARNIINNKDYLEEFEYFAPLYVSPNNLPSKFIVFRVDGTGLSRINKQNIRQDIFQKFKTVKLFDLTKSSSLGEWLDTNFNNNSFYPLTPFEMSFDNLEFTKWNGIDYKTGGYTSKSIFMENMYEDEREIFEFEKMVFDGYKNNQVVFPNILNLSFLFDDTPATSETIKTWSINRYYGFYLDDMIQVQTMSPYVPPQLKSNVMIASGNIFVTDPFVEEFSDDKIYNVEYQGEYYSIEKFTYSVNNILQPVKSGKVTYQQYGEQIVTKYRIISDVDLIGKQSELNQNSGWIDVDGRLSKYDGSNFEISDWDTADIWIIEIDCMYHNLIKDASGIIKVYTDYSFSFYENEYYYWINKPDPTMTKKVNFLVDADNPPKKFTIYKLKFSDIKDFDDRIINTEYSKYEYEKKYELTDTDETKMYLSNLWGNSNPKDFDDFIYQDGVVNIPVSSEYTANYETFKIEKDELTQLWKKNPVYCRWGFQNSLSANDCPYVLNNSLLFEDYNRTINPFDPDPKRIERNLDYFYTINSSTSSYIHHSLHIENSANGVINTNYKFELDKYLNLATYSTGTMSATYSFDYFTYFFEHKSTFDSGLINKNVKKYSLFNSGDTSVPNITLFRGIKFLIYDVEDIKSDSNGKIDIVNLKNSNTFDDYKFSILLSDNEWSVSDSGGITSSSNTMDWTIIDKWQMEKFYDVGSIVVYDDILYISTQSVTTTIPDGGYKYTKSAPYNQVDWNYYNFEDNILWCPTASYIIDDVVFNYNDYYQCVSDSGGENDFWNPASFSVGYDLDSVILFQGQYYQSMTSSNRVRPDYQSSYYSGTYSYFWIATQSSSNNKWCQILLWNPSVSYGSATYIVHEDIVYESASSVDAGNEPSVSSDWTRYYSLHPDTLIVYDIDTNPLIKMNDAYYLINSNTSESTLENGINIYINKKWKNIFINIAILDNTTPGISNQDRDYLYTQLNKKLTAFNFIQSINDISNKYDFADYISYIIINEDDTIEKYKLSDYYIDDGIKGLPYFITCETPDEILMRLNSLIDIPIDIPKDLKPTHVLNTEITNDLSNLNDYNNIPVAVDIISNPITENPIMINYHGFQNSLDNTIYRFSGFYMPVFYDIQLFSKDFYTSSVGNYKFDVELSEFGIVKERKIRKINKNGSILRLRNVRDQKSIYPMLDEFGYSWVDFFIFKSTWDYEYHYTTSLNNYKEIVIPVPLIDQTNVGQVNIFQPYKNIN